MFENLIGFALAENSTEIMKLHKVGFDIVSQDQKLKSNTILVLKGMKFFIFKSY